MEVWQITGHVVDDNGIPVSGARVYVFAGDHVYVDMRRGTRTDGDGWFDVVYDINVRDLIEHAPDLYVTVEDPKGNLLLKQHVGYEANRIDYFHIVAPPPHPSEEQDCRPWWRKILGS